MIRSWCQELSCLPETVWAAYAKSRDPLNGCVTMEDYLPHYHAAQQCGVKLARQVREQFGAASCEELAEKLDVRVVRLPMPDGDGLLTFAAFEEPALIRVYTDNAEATQTIITQSGADEYLGNVDICQMLLAHELFHVLQLRHPELYVNQKHIRLWKIGRWIRESRLLSLEEVAAMAFARKMLGMKVNPYVYDVLMLLPQATEQARKLYERVLDLKEETCHE